jgi:uncharacterized phiE125 gp8 family phage protein
MRFLDLEIVAPPTELPVTVQEFVDHGRLNGLTVDRQPDLIERELRTATTRGEQYTRRSFLTQTIRALYLPESSCNCGCALLMPLPRGKVQSVISVMSGGEVVPAGNYRLDWNTLVLTQPLTAAASVEYLSGFGDDPLDVPDGIKEGILQYATVLYGNRQGERDNRYQSSADKTIPVGIVDLWRPFQVELGG